MSNEQLAEKQMLIVLRVLTLKYLFLSVFICFILYHLYSLYLIINWKVFLLFDNKAKVIIITK